MAAPFTAEQFFTVFAHCNAGIWPAHVGSVAALQFGVTQDFALPIAAAATLLFALPPRAVTRWKEAT